MPRRCTRCGNCCRWPGDVRLGQGEVEEIAVQLNLTVEECVERYTRLAADRRALSLIEAQDGSCVFLEGINVCAIEAAKPRQCRTFPNGWSFPGFERWCRAEVVNA